jgi:hypothetical protein
MNAHTYRRSAAENYDYGLGMQELRDAVRQNNPNGVVGPDDGEFSVYLHAFRT